MKVDQVRKYDFTITVWYFKDSGKLYAEGGFTGSFTDCGPTGHPSCCMGEVKNHICSLRDGKKPLPGLQGGWDGPILVDCNEGYPVLILPERWR